MEATKSVAEQGKTTAGTANKPSTAGMPGHTMTAPQHGRDTAAGVGSGSQTAHDQPMKAAGDAHEKTSEGGARPTGHSSGPAGHAITAPHQHGGSDSVADDVSNGVHEAYDQTVKAVSDAYEKTSEAVSHTYDQTMTYGRHHPGQLTMIAFGAGIGIGILLASGFSGGRSRNSRLAEPIVGALSEVALELFRNR